MRVVLLSSGGDGQHNDVLLFDQLLREWNLRNGGKAITSIDRLDPVTFLNPSRPPQRVDLQIHIETPCRAAMPWARCNVVLVNPEWWPATAWNWVAAPVAKGGAHLFLFRSAHGRTLFPDIEDARACVLPWRAPAPPTALSLRDRKRACLYLVGRSIPKFEAAKEVLPHWNAAWPPLTVVTTEARIAELRTLVPPACTGHIHFRTMYETTELRMVDQRESTYHLLASTGEGYGYGFAEAAAAGALPLWYGLPVYDSLWGSVLGNVGRVPVRPIAGAEDVYRDGRYCATSSDALCAAANALFSLEPAEDARMRAALMRKVDRAALRSAWTDCMRLIRGAVARAVVRELPPAPLPPARLPTVAVVTLTRNRRGWFANMVRNILMSGYPRERLTWVVVDDGDEGQRIDSEVQRFQTSHPEVRVVYLLATPATTLGEKRNRGIAAAPTDCSVILMMDDDDHYPAGSIARRIAWMTALDVDCVYCSTLPMYHCGKYISAYNTPPLDLAPEERVSEATLCFRRTFWETRGFPVESNMAEGAGFLSGRIERAAEIHPAGVIVSFLHGANATSRRVPATTEPNGCHYGFEDDYFLYLSNLATDTL
jgi:hypothetical protein